MTRHLKILLSQYKELPFNEFCELIINSLYTDDPLYVYRYDLEAEVRDVGMAPHSFIINKGDLADLNDEHRKHKACPWEFLCNQYDGVEDFFIAKNADGIQHISWIYYKNDQNRLLSLAANEAEIKFCLTLPSCRGQGIYPHVLLNILAFLKEQGVTHVFMCVHVKNKSSIRGIEKSGFYRVGEFRFRKLLGVQISKKYDTARLK